jgi:tetratricopeptide (TPR) repeat protein
MKLIKYIFLVLFLINFSNLNADERDIKLNELFNELKINNSSLTFETEQKIWKIWSTHPSNQKLTDRLSEGSAFVRNKQLLKAVKIYTNIINQDPNWAEAWNKRATVLYMMGDYQGSQNDIDKVLKLEDRHFGALAGQGLVNIKLENYEKSIKSYKRAKEIYPTMQSPSIMIKQIEELIKQQLI